MKDADRMIQNLSLEMDRKCEELQAKHKERIQSRIFLLICILVAVVPALLILVGVSLTMLIVPILLMSLIVVLLLPVLLQGQRSEEGGTLYE